MGGLFVTGSYLAYNFVKILREVELENGICFFIHVIFIELLINSKWSDQISTDHSKFKNTLIKTHFNL